MEQLRTFHFGERLKELVANDVRGGQGYVDQFEVTRQSLNNRYRNGDMKFSELLATMEYFDVDIEQFFGTEYLESLLPAKYKSNVVLNDIAARLASIEGKLDKQLT